MGEYASWLLSRVPGWLGGAWGQRWWAAIGAELDALVDETKLAVRAGWILEAPTEALGRHGADTQLERYPVDSDTTYRGRLAGAWELWPQAGTVAGIHAALDASALAPDPIEIAAQWQWGGVPDGLTAAWSRLWAIRSAGSVRIGSVDIGHFTFGASSWDLLRIGSFTIGTGVCIGVDCAPSEIERIRRAMRRWKSARTRVARLFVATGPLIGQPGLAIGAFVLGCESVALGSAPVIGYFTIGDETDPVIGRALFC